MNTSKPEKGKKKEKKKASSLIGFFQASFSKPDFLLNVHGSKSQNG